MVVGRPVVVVVVGAIVVVVDGAVVVVVVVDGAIVVGVVRVGGGFLAVVVGVVGAGFAAIVVVEDAAVVVIGREIVVLVEVATGVGLSKVAPDDGAVVTTALLDVLRLLSNLLVDNEFTEAAPDFRARPRVRVRGA